MAVGAEKKLAQLVKVSPFKIPTSRFQGRDYGLHIVADIFFHARYANG